jgi:hypothetical protein
MRKTRELEAQFNGSSPGLVHGSQHDMCLRQEQLAGLGEPHRSQRPVERAIDSRSFRWTTGGEPPLPGGSPTVHRWCHT